MSRIDKAQFFPDDIGPEQRMPDHRIQFRYFWVEFVFTDDFPETLLGFKFRIIMEESGDRGFVFVNGKTEAIDQFQGFLLHSERMAEAFFDAGLAGFLVFFPRATFRIFFKRSPRAS